MKRHVLGLLTGILFLTACGGTSPVTQTTPIAIIEQATSTATQTPTPSATPTASITPLPIIPTFTQTFDASTIVTVTPASMAECPTLQKNKLLDIIKYEIGSDKVIIESLNQGISIDKVAAALDRGISEYYETPGLKRARYQMQDLTNDGVSEIVLQFVAFLIIGCQNGEYRILFELPPDGQLLSPSTTSFRDVNSNGILDLTILLGVASQGGHSYGVYEWDGEKFSSRIRSDNPEYSENGFVWVEVTGGIHYDDVNNDNVQELIVDSGIPLWETYHSGLPWRNKRTIYKWNGKYYVPDIVEFAQPELRYQAIQDGDIATDQREYNKAFELYQAGIFDTNLRGYSPEIRKNLQNAWLSQIGSTPVPTPTQYPDDPTEYPSLAAYAYYRIMLLHLVQNQESEATTTYNTLQEKFGNDPYARAYVDMASAFWQAYQSTHKMYDGCAAAIQYAAEHPEILIPLGSDYHGAQSHIYVAEDVCPFR